MSFLRRSALGRGRAGSRGHAGRPKRTRAHAGLDEPRRARSRRSSAARRCTGRARASACGARARSPAMCRRCVELRLDCDADALLLKVRAGRRHRLPHRTRELLLSQAGRRALGEHRPGAQGSLAHLPKMKPGLAQTLERIAAHHRRAPRRRPGKVVRRAPAYRRRGRGPQEDRRGSRPRPCLPPRAATGSTSCARPPTCGSTA